LKLVDKKYLDGEYGQKGQTAIDKAKQAKGKLIKERHYKVLNDAANREIFGGKISKVLTDYRKRKPHLKNYWDYDKVGKGFLKSARNPEIAEYLISRHNIGHAELPGVGKLFKQRSLHLNNPNLTYIKWFDNSISGVLRGAQFNYKTYELLNTLKHTATNTSEAMRAIKNAGYIPNPTANGKVLFSFSPSIKSNFDWGGYNAVAEWDPSKAGKVRFHATDLRDTPISSVFKGKHVLNYVKSKEINIVDMKEHVDDGSKVSYSKVRKKMAPRDKDIKKLKTREDIVRSGKLKVGGQYKTIRENLHIIRDKKIRSKKRLTAKNVLKQAIKKGKLPKNVFKYVKGLGGVGLGAAGILLLANTMFGDD
jgi:hypothetical protein